MRKLNIDKSYTGFNMYHTCGEILRSISSYRIVNVYNPIFKVCGITARILTTYYLLYKFLISIVKKNRVRINFLTLFNFFIFSSQ